jgi:hypothetical protein
MKVSLFSFQQRALQDLRMSVDEAIGSYQRTHTPQVISFTAPTGAGKTIIMSSFIENIYFGDERYPENPEAIFVWLSDSPELNEQSKLKIDLKADKIAIGKTVTINDSDFNQEVLDDGYIYFLNTQKLGKSSNLTKYRDKRQYTIWDTLRNTVKEKSNRLYFIIDEAHRGMQDKAAAKATTIMQKFLKGSEIDNLPIMPVVIGISATPSRFNALVEGTSSTIHKVVVTADEVRASGLLKDRIIITYSEESNVNKEMAVLQAAADEWKNKWDHWQQYSYEQHYAHVNPIFVIQVENGTNTEISKTDLHNCLKTIEDRIGYKFEQHEVVHAFGNTESVINISGLDVLYIEPSRINDDKKIKVVFFKENLSTGWDCPRAETMMSFRRAKDSTYIAQLLGRMVRTPMQMSIQVDESLNDVHLFLPYFEKETVDEVVEALQSAEGGDIPTEIGNESLENKRYEQLSIKTKNKTKFEEVNTSSVNGQITMFDETTKGVENPNNNSNSIQHLSSQFDKEKQMTVKMSQEANDIAPTPVHLEESTENNLETSVKVEDAINREKIVKAINDTGLLNYSVRKVQINNYLKSLYSLARLIVQTGLNISEVEAVHNEIVNQIKDYIDNLKENGNYDEQLNKAKEFKLSSKVYDAFGETVDTQLDIFENSYITTDTDIDRQFRLAESKLGNEGIAKFYVSTFYDTNLIDNLKLEVVLFVTNESFTNIHLFAKKQFHKLNDKYRRLMAKQNERTQNQYNKIVSDGDIVSKSNFRLPETITATNDNGGEKYFNHLYVNEDGFATIKLNTWEKGVLEEEFKRDDFVSWLRNPSRGSWGLRVPYKIDGIFKPAYPDFIIIRKDLLSEDDYIIDILEPHNPEFRDNLPKAKGLAEYARQNPGVGRIELIRKGKDATGSNGFNRLDLSKSSIRDKVFRVQSDEELTHLFETDGKFH